MQHRPTKPIPFLSQYPCLLTPDRLPAQCARFSNFVVQNVFVGEVICIESRKFLAGLQSYRPDKATLISKPRRLHAVLMQRRMQEGVRRTLRSKDLKLGHRSCGRFGAKIWYDEQKEVGQVEGVRWRPTAGRPFDHSYDRFPVV